MGRQQYQEGRSPVAAYKFKPGHETWNKGVSMHLSPLSEWKQGDTALDKHPQWKGGVQHIINDCAYLAIAANVRVRRPRYIYEQRYGKIPNGFVIYHKDGNKDNDNVENLVAISRAELAKLNTKERD